MINIRLAVHPLIQSRTTVPSYGGFNRGVESPVVALCHVRDAALSARGGNEVSVSLVNYTTSVVLDQVAALPTVGWPPEYVRTQSTIQRMRSSLLTTSGMSLMVCLV